MEAERREGERRLSRPTDRTPITPVAIFIIGILLTVLATGATSIREANRNTEAFTSTARTRTEAVEARMRELTLKLQNLSAFVSASESEVPSQAEWNRFIVSSEMDNLDELPLLVFVKQVERESAPAGAGVSVSEDRLIASRIHSQDPGQDPDGPDPAPASGSSTAAPTSPAERSIDVSSLEIANYLELSETTRRTPLFVELENDFFAGAATSPEADRSALPASPRSRVAFAIPALESGSTSGDSPLRGWIVGVADTELILLEETEGTPFRIQMELLQSGASTSAGLVVSHSPDGLRLEDAEQSYSSQALLGDNLWRFHAYADASYQAQGLQVSPIILVLGLVSTLMITLGATLRWRAATRSHAMRQLVDRTNEIARTDELTGLANRAGLISALTTALGQASPEAPVAALFMDLNRFKNINDTLGHGAGDELLRSVGHKLASRTRPGETLARFGGDEFVLVSPCLASGDDAQESAQRMIDSLDETFDLASGATKVSMAVGIALAASPDDHTPESLLRDADLAMYRAKRGNDRIGVFDDSMRIDAVSRMEIERQLQTGLDDLRVHYQPIIETSSGRVTTVEALVRWDRPGVGLVSPGEFLDVVAEAGLVDELGMVVLQQATSDVAERNLASPDDTPTALAVNVVLSQLLDPDFLHEVANVLEASGLAPQLLTLELSEDIALEHLAGVLRIIRPLSRLGINLSIDDFGTGNTSLAHLTRLDQVSELKIDGSFIGDLPTDLAAEALVRGMLTIAQRLDLHVVAEGVENLDIYRACVELGIPSLQGYLLGRPTELSQIPRTVPMPDITAPEAESSNAPGGAALAQPR